LTILLREFGWILDSTSYEKIIFNSDIEIFMDIDFLSYTMIHRFHHKVSYNDIQISS